MKSIQDRYRIAYLENVLTKISTQALLDATDNLSESSKQNAETHPQSVLLLSIQEELSTLWTLDRYNDSTLPWDYRSNIAKAEGCDPLILWKKRRSDDDLLQQDIYDLKPQLEQMRQDVQTLRAQGDSIDPVEGLSETVKGLINQDDLKQKRLVPLKITERLTVEQFCNDLDGQLDQALGEMNRQIDPDKQEQIEAERQAQIEAERQAQIEAERQAQPKGISTISVVFRGLASIAGAGLVGGGLTAMVLLVVGATSAAVTGLSMAVNIPLVGAFPIIGLGAVLGAVIGGLGYGLWSAYKGHPVAQQPDSLMGGSITAEGSQQRSKEGSDSFNATQASSGGSSLRAVGESVDAKSSSNSSLEP